MSKNIQNKELCAEISVLSERTSTVATQTGLHKDNSQGLVLRNPKVLYWRILGELNHRTRRQSHKKKSDYAKSSVMERFLPTVQSLPLSPQSQSQGWTLSKLRSFPSNFFQSRGNVLGVCNIPSDTLGEKRILVFTKRA